MNDNGHDMTDDKFVNLAKDLSWKIEFRTPRRWPPGFLPNAADRAQWPTFMRDLMQLLVDERVPITPAERDIVVRLMKHQHMDLGPVDRFDVSDTIGRVTDDMTYSEFVEHGTDLTIAILDRLPERHRNGFIGEIEHGIQEPMIFMTYLVFTLVEEQVPITLAERDMVVRLMKHRGMDLRPAQRFNVDENLAPPPTGDMTHDEFVDVATDLVNRIKDRLPQNWRDEFTEDIAEHFEWPGIFVWDLVDILDGEQVPITPAERDTVVRLMKRRRISLLHAERLNVTAAAGQE